MDGGSDSGDNCDDHNGSCRIALDVDGVLADVMQAWLRMTNPGRLGPLSKSDMTDWDFWSRYGVKKRDFYTQLDACWNEWGSLPPTEPDLARATEGLSRIGAVDIVTARSTATNRHVRMWLKLHNVSYRRYVHVAAGHMKADLDYDVFIDDSPVNAEAFLRNGKRVILYTQPWNTAVADSPPRLVRVSSLRQAAEAAACMAPGGGHHGSQ